MLQVYCDGSAHERRGLPGGWAFALVERDVLRFAGSGAVPATTNNEVELRAAISGLKEVVARRLHAKARVELISDSRMTLDVAPGVEAPAVHAVLGAELRALALETRAVAIWVRGHSGNRWNEHVDAIAHRAKLTLVPLRKQSH